MSKLKLFEYGTENSAGPSQADSQILSDWNRWQANPDKCPIYINDQRLTDIREKEFCSIDDLKQFLLTTLFQNNRKSLEANYRHFHQGGLVTSTHICLVNNPKSDAKPAEPVYMIRFSTNVPGVLTLKEQHTYKGKISSIHTGKILVDACPDPNAFHAQTITTHELNLKDKDAKFEVKTLEIDCQDEHLAPLLGDGSLTSNKGLLSRIKEFISDLYEALVNLSRNTFKM